MLTKTATISETQRELNEELRHYAQSMQVVQVCPIKSIVVTAVEENFPGLLEESELLEEALEELGLVMIEDIGQGYRPKRISWSIADRETEAKAQLERYSDASYTALRRALDINYHWIFLVPDGDLYSQSDDALLDGLIDFESADKPDCWILDRFR